MSHHFIVGWPGAGKTTFVAAAYGALMEAASTAELRLGTLGDDDHTYICAIHDRWSKGLPLARTKESDRQKCVLPLQIDGGARQVDLIFNDVGGELFNNAFDERGLPVDVAKAASTCAGVLLFLPADRSAEEAFAPIESLQDALAALEKRENEKDAEQGAVEIQAATATELWSAEAATIQGKAVDILQNIAADGRRRRLAILVTKWDLLSGTENGVDSWFERHYALVAQYVKNNSSSWHFTIFGVSAQGGALETLGKTIALGTDRAYAVAGTVRAEFVAPIAWVISRDGSSEEPDKG